MTGCNDADMTDYELGQAIHAQVCRIISRIDRAFLQLADDDIYAALSKARDILADARTEIYMGMTP